MWSASSGAGRCWNTAKYSEPLGQHYLSPGYHYFWVQPQSYSSDSLTLYTSNQCKVCGMNFKTDCFTNKSFRKFQIQIKTVCDSVTVSKMIRIIKWPILPVRLEVKFNVSMMFIIKCISVPIRHSAKLLKDTDQHDLLWYGLWFNSGEFT